MGLVGQLADLSLDDILKIIQLSRKSGKLTLLGHGQEWAIAFWQGEIVRLSSALVGPALIAELKRQNLVERDFLEQVLEADADVGPVCSETLLDSRFGVSPETLGRVSREVGERFLAELTAWEDGDFSFDLWEDADALPPASGPDHLYLRQYPGSAVSEGACSDADGDPAELNSLEKDENADSSGAQVKADDAPRNVPPVWIVDDDPYFRQVLGDYLGGCGMAVEPFETAADFWIGLKKARLAGISPLVLIDQHMPPLTGEGAYGGLELLERVRGAYPDLRVYFLCEAGHGEMTAEVRRVGLSEIFIKPENSHLGLDSGRQMLHTIALTLQNAQAGVETRVAGKGACLPAGTDNKAKKRRPGKSVYRFENSPGLHLLKGMLEELHNPALGGGIILLVLRFASEIMNRAVIFSVKENHFVGIGQFGVVLEDGETDAVIRNIAIPRDGDSILGEILDKPFCLRTRFGDGVWDEALCRTLGGESPTEIFLGPIVSEGRVVAVLYGDNLPEKRAVGNAEALEIFLSQAGVAMEKALLEGKLLGAHPG